MIIIMVRNNCLNKFMHSLQYINDVPEGYLKVFVYNLNVMKNHLYEMSEHVLNIYQCIVRIEFSPLGTIDVSDGH